MMATPTVDLTTIKILINIIISTKNDCFITSNLKDFYLGTLIKQKYFASYIHIPVSLIPDKIMEMRKLEPLVKSGHVYVGTKKGMNGLPQAGIIANE
jgi:hypothetical protein